MSILLALAAAAASPPAPSGPEASIPFFSTVTSPDWRIDGDRGLWLRGNTAQWFYVAFNGPCPRADAALNLSFQTNANDAFDKFGTVYAGGDICPVSSVVKSDPPPKRQHKG